METKTKLHWAHEPYGQWVETPAKQQDLLHKTQNVWNEASAVLLLYKTSTVPIQHHSNFKNIALFAQQEMLESVEFQPK